MKCEAFWVRCRSRATKGARFTNIFREQAELRLCAEHLDYYLANRQVLLDSALDVLNVVQESGPPIRPLAEMLGHPAQKALLDHQATCATCAGVRDWLLEQINAGLVRGPEDFQRIGLYVAEHACEEGVRLNAAVGRAMLADDG